QLVRLRARPCGRDLARPSLDPARERPADAPPPGVRGDPAGERVDRDPAPDDDVHLDLADDAAVELGDDDVALDVEVRLVAKVVPDLVRTERHLGAIGDRALVDESDQPVDVGVEVDAPEPEPGD